MIDAVAVLPANDITDEDLTKVLVKGLSANLPLYGSEHSLASLLDRQYPKLAILLKQCESWFAPDVVAWKDRPMFCSWYECRRVAPLETINQYSGDLQRCSWCHTPRFLRPVPDVTGLDEAD